MLSSAASHPVTNNHSWETESFHLNAAELRITPHVCSAHVITGLAQEGEDELIESKYMWWVTQVSAAAASAVLYFLKNMIFVCFLNEAELGLGSGLQALRRSCAVSHCGARALRPRRVCSPAVVCGLGWPSA